MSSGNMGSLISLVFWLFNLLILARIFLSWVPMDPSNPIVQFIHQATEPFLAPIRSKLPPSAGFDFSPLVLLVILYVLQIVITQLLGR